MTEPACECPAPGYCRRYQLVQSDRAHALCRGAGCSPQVSAAYREKWARRAAGGATAVASLPVVPAAGPPRKPAARFSLDCVHRGEPTGETVACRVCGGTRQVALHACAAHGVCSVEMRAERPRVPGEPAAFYPWCRTCPDKAAPGQTRVRRVSPLVQLDPSAEGAEIPPDHHRAGRPEANTLLQFDHTTLCPDLPRWRFNPSLTEYRDGYLFAFRDGWRGSNVHVVPLDREFAPAGEAVRLDLWHAEANYGREDPRLFWFRGAVHVAYIGVVGGCAGVKTSVLYARLGDDLRAEQVFYPHLPARNAWEKNWSFFEAEGGLFAVYSVSPHRVLRVSGDRAEFAHETPGPAPWHPGTEMRGGASPVRVGDEFWSFIHSSRTDPDGMKVYYTGLYTFSAAPPFRPLRIIPDAIDTANRATNPDNYAAVLFACGAVRQGGRWVVSSGLHDRWSELRVYDHADLDRRLIPVG